MARWLIVGVIVTAILGAFAWVVIVNYNEPPQHGVVVAKAYRAEHSGVMIMPGPKGISTIIPTHTDECWELTLDDKGNTGTVCVPRPAYDSTPIGARY